MYIVIQYIYIYTCIDHLKLVLPYFSKGFNCISVLATRDRPIVLIFFTYYAMAAVLKNFTYYAQNYAQE